MIRSLLRTLPLAAAIALVAAPALADDDDKAACASLAEGDACTDGAGQAGTCVPDDSDAVLTCDDDGSSSAGSTSGSATGSTGGSDDGSDGSSDDSGGCSVGAGAPSDAAGLLLVAAAALAGARRRRS